MNVLQCVQKVAFVEGVASGESGLIRGELL